MGAPTLVEASAVAVARKDPGGEVALDGLLERLVAEVVELSVPAARIARFACSRYGEGASDLPVLNFGDCLSYGVAVELRELLLFKGDDFLRTDIEVASY